MEAIDLEVIEKARTRRSFELYLDNIRYDAKIIDVRFKPFKADTRRIEINILINKFAPNNDTDFRAIADSEFGLIGPVHVEYHGNNLVQLVGFSSHKPSKNNCVVCGDYCVPEPPFRCRKHLFGF